MQNDMLCLRIQDTFNMLLFKYSFTFYNNFVTFDRYHFTGIFIHKVFNPCAQSPCSKLTANRFFKGSFAHFNFIGKAEELKYFLICFKANSPEQGCYW